MCVHGLGGPSAGDVDRGSALNLEEFTYLDENMAAVLAVLRRTNPLNDLLLVGNAGLPATCGGLPVYTVTPDEGDWVARRVPCRRTRSSGVSVVYLNYPISLRVWNLLGHWATSLVGTSPETPRSPHATAPICLQDERSREARKHAPSPRPFPQPDPEDVRSKSLSRRRPFATLTVSRRPARSRPTEAR